MSMDIFKELVVVLGLNYDCVEFYYMIQKSFINKGLVLI